MLVVVEGEPAENDAQPDLKQQLFQAGESLAVPAAPADGQLQPVIGSPHGPQPEQAEQGELHIKVAAGSPAAAW